MNKKSILLKNANNKIRISFADANDLALEANQSSTGENQDKKTKVRTTMGYSPEDLDLEEAKAIALGLGVPKFLIENLNVLPVKGKSYGAAWLETYKQISCNILYPYAF